MAKEVEEFIKLYIKNSACSNVVSVGLEINPVSKKVGILLTVMMDNVSLRNKTVSNLLNTIPKTYTYDNTTYNVRVRGSAAVVLY